MEVDEFDSDEGLSSVDKAVDFLKERGATNPSQYPTYTGGSLWFSDDGEEDYSTGATKTLSYHPKGFSEEELREIFQRVIGKAGVRESKSLNDYLKKRKKYHKTS